MRYAGLAGGLLLAIALGGLSLARADRVRLIDSDEDAAQIRVDLVRQARSTSTSPTSSTATTRPGVGFHSCARRREPGARCGCSWTGSGTKSRGR